VLEKQFAYWKEQLAGAPELLALPLDRPRPPKMTFRCSRQSFVLPRNLMRGLSELSQKEGATLFMTLLAAYQTLMYRYTGQEDICLGSPIANRNRAEIEGMIGCFLNIVVLRTDLSGNPSFKELLGRVREVTAGAYANQDLPFEKLVDELQPERSLNHAPMVQATFTYQNAPMDALDLSDLTLESIEIEGGMVEQDLSLIINGMAGLVIYNSDLFNDSTISQMIEHFSRILEAVAADPDVRLLRIPLNDDQQDEHSEFPLNFQALDEAEHFAFGGAE
jgi:non-ribosomal peptide synthetase component F